MCVSCRPPLQLSRRGFLAGGAAVLAAGLRPSRALAEVAPGAPNAISPDEALARIMAGNARAAANLTANRDPSSGRASLARAQYPIAAILSCADSRVPPELAFDQGAGDLFVVRVAGNFVSDDGLASIEYGVGFLGIPLVMVLGHSGCGAVDATIKVVRDGAALPGRLPGLANAIRPAVEAARAKNPADLLSEATAENVRANVRRLEGADPLIGAPVRQGRVKVVGAVFDIPTGKVHLV